MATHSPPLSALTVAAIVIWGCSAPAPQPVTSVPAAAASSPTRPEAPRPDHPPPVAAAESEPESRITLPALLAYVDAHAPALRTARARAELGDAEVTAASPLFPANPEIGTTWGHRTTGGAQTPYSFAIQQELEIAGERGLRLEAAERSRDLAQAENDAVHWDVQWRVRAGFYKALLAAERLAVADRTVAFSENVLGVARKRVDAGEESPLTLLAPQAEVAQARQSRIAASQVVRSARLRLAELSGWPTDTALQPVGDLPPVRRAKPDAALWALAESANPELRTRQETVRESEARVRLRDREAWPRPTVGLGYSREGDTTLNTVWSLSLSVPVPVWNRNEGERARAMADLAVARSEESGTRSALRARILEAASAVDSAAERTRLYEKDILPALERNLDLILRAYRIGELDITQVSLTRDRLLQSRRDALEARGAYFDAAAELESLVGSTEWSAGEQP